MSDKHKDERKIQPGSIEDIVRQATKAGMSYGRYLQHQYEAHCREERARKEGR